MRLRALGVIAAASALVLSLCDGRESVQAPSKPSIVEAAGAVHATSNVVVAMHLEEPLATDRTVVWTVAFQAAWDALDEQVRARWHVPRLDLGSPAPPDDVRALLRGRLAPGSVAPKDLTVIAGPATEETWSRIDRESLGGRPAGAPPPRALDLVAYARLNASVRYELPFHVETEPILFGVSGIPVRGYGLMQDTSGPAANRLREQAEFHLDPSIHDDEVARRAVVVLKGMGGRRVIVSGRPPKATLGETWGDVARAVRTIPATRFSVVDRLAIPRVSIIAGRSFDSLVGAEVRGMPGSEIVLAREDVHLTADEQGADVDAEAVIVAVGALPKSIVFDGPFLIALCVEGSDQPYAMAWLGAADGISRWGEPLGRALVAEEARPFVGSWTLDVAATVEASLGRQRRALPPSPEKIGWDPEGMRKQWRDHFSGQSLNATIDSEGVVTLDPTPGERRKRTGESRLMREGARLVLTVPSGDQSSRDDEPSGSREGAPAASDARGEDRWIVSREGDRLWLTEPGAGAILVLTRR